MWRLPSEGQGQDPDCIAAPQVLLTVASLLFVLPDLEVDVGVDSMMITMEHFSRQRELALLGAITKEAEGDFGSRRRLATAVSAQHHRRLAVQWGLLPEHIYGD